MGDRARHKLWAQDALAEIEYFRARLAVTTHVRERPRRRWSSPPAPDAHAPVAAGEAKRLLDLATDAACGRKPRYVPVVSWWSGNCTESAFRHVHNAEAVLVTLYDQGALRAEVPEAVRRAQESLAVGDPMRALCHRMFLAWEKGQHIDASDLAKLIEAGHAAADRQRARLRMFRNVLITGFAVTALLLICLVALAAWRPNLVPLCFVQNPPPAGPNLPNIVCPVKSIRNDNLTLLHTAPSSLDFFTVAVLGLMGGALSSALFIRDLYANATPYNVTVPLALLKLPAGALTGLVGIILLAGEFVPGFSAIDKPIQILAYALVFGFAQQLFTQYLDQRAQRLVNSVPTKTRGASVPDTPRAEPC
ncbi:hypothetical protein JIG36_12835 [Actinoplanes sp. LDG1-06]|uniref:Uncharacterized protein n=1 Tax=Paractinoplanes ovalisporus TaxID=2810368 RepID=A0ABS2A9D3_9ACTN|nr:hypothetical protein [Actinoplanes ovalisporus]MBM2616443.1 hypothetical protein [Actinoplanes ovalisporus]